MPMETESKYESLLEEQHEKDPHRYSFSRLDAFRQCPRKHHYLYVERLPEPRNEYALSGSFFHKAVETILKGDDVEPVYEDFRKAVDTGVIHLDRDQLEYTVSHYFAHWYAEYSNEETLGVEMEFDLSLDEEDTMVMKLDQAVRSNGLVGVRDMKSTRSALKYDEESVRTNMQLLTYVRPLEAALNETVGFVEIDEVRMAKLEESVPLVQKGKPSTSMEGLQLVTEELYRDELERQGLLDDPKYQAVLQKLHERGHPLFNRVRVQLSNRYLLEDNEEELRGIYVAASIDTKYRIKDRSKCFMCPFSRICELDQYGGDSLNRQKLIELLQ